MTDFRQSSIERREGERRALLEPSHEVMEPTGWHLDHKIPIGLLLAMIGQVVGVVWFFAGIKQDVELLKADTAALHTRDNQQADSFREAIKTLQEQFARVDAKLDRLIERDHTR